MGGDGNDTICLPGGVQRFKVVDKSDFSPSRLTVHSDPPYSKEALPVFLFQAARIVMSVHVYVFLLVVCLLLYLALLWRLCWFHLRPSTSRGGA